MSAFTQKLLARSYDIHSLFPVLSEAANSHSQNQGAFARIVCRQLPAKLSMFGQ